MSYEQDDASMKLITKLTKYAHEESPQYEEGLVAGMSVSRRFMMPIDTELTEGDEAHILLNGETELGDSEQEWISIELGLSAMRGVLLVDEGSTYSMPYEEFVVWINSTRTVRLGDSTIPDNAFREMSESMTVGDPGELSEDASIDEIRAKFCEEMGDETTLTHSLNRTYTISDRDIPDIRIHESNLYTFDDGDNTPYGIIRQDLFIPEKERELLDLEGDDTERAGALTL